MRPRPSARTPASVLPNGCRGSRASGPSQPLVRSFGEALGRSRSMSVPTDTSTRRLTVERQSVSLLGQGLSFHFVVKDLRIAATSIENGRSHRTEGELSDVTGGPGWWQASDLKWYPPHLHPNYVAPPPPTSHLQMPHVTRQNEPVAQAPTARTSDANYVTQRVNGPNAPGWWQASDGNWYPPDKEPAATGAPHVLQAPTVVVQMPSVSVATVKDTLGKLSVTAWLLLGGSVVAAIAIFFPWQTITLNADELGLGNLGTDNSALAGGTRFAVLLVIAAALWLAWPTQSGSAMSVRRLTGLSVVVGLLVGAFVLGFYGVSDNNRINAGNGMSFSAGFGLLLYTAAVVAIVVGVVRVWMRRSGVGALVTS